jgi:lipopolysaccharide export system protein LptA
MNADTLKAVFSGEVKIWSGSLKLKSGKNIVHTKSGDICVFNDTLTQQRTKPRRRSKLPTYGQLRRKAGK